MAADTEVKVKQVASSVAGIEAQVASVQRQVEADSDAQTTGAAVASLTHNTPLPTIVPAKREDLGMSCDLAWQVRAVHVVEKSTGEDGTETVKATAHYEIYRPVVYYKGKEFTNIKTDSGGALDTATGWTSLKGVVPTPDHPDGHIVAKFEFNVSTDPNGYTSKELASVKIAFKAVTPEGGEEEKAEEGKEFVYVNICELAKESMQSYRQIHTGVLMFEAVSDKADAPVAWKGWISSEEVKGTDKEGNETTTTKDVLKIFHPVWHSGRNAYYLDGASAGGTATIDMNKTGVLYAVLKEKGTVKEETVDGETVDVETWTVEGLEYCIGSVPADTKPEKGYASDEAKDGYRYRSVAIGKLGSSSWEQWHVGAIVEAVTAATASGGGGADIEDPRVYITKIGSEVWLTQGQKEEETEGGVKAYQPLHKILRLDSILWQTAMVEMGDSCGSYCALIRTTFDWNKCTSLANSGGAGKNDIQLDGENDYGKNPTGGDGELLRGYCTSWMAGFCASYPEDETSQGSISGCAYCGVVFSNVAPSASSDSTVYFYTELYTVNEAKSTYSEANV